MSAPRQGAGRARQGLGLAGLLLPLRDAAGPGVGWPRLARLSLFQVSAGLTLVLLGGTLNRVMAVELAIPTTLVAAALGLPLLLAPARVLIGLRSDRHRSHLGWRRTPYIWIGALLQFGGLALMPLSLLLVAQGDPETAAAGRTGLFLSFFLAGIGLHAVQTAGLALACDLVEAQRRPQVVALLHVTLLLGMVAGSLAVGRLLADFTALRLIEVLKGSALLTLALTGVALWRQEPRRRDLAPGPAEGDGAGGGDVPRTAGAWASVATMLREGGDLGRLLVALAVGTAAFGMQDVLLEPYGGEVFAMGVGGTTALTALFAGGGLAGFAAAAGLLGRRDANPHAVAALGALAGVPAFSAIVLSGALAAEGLFALGTFGIGLGSGLFSVAMLIAAMERVASQGAGQGAGSGLLLGMWSAVQALSLGLALLAGGALRDQAAALVSAGALGPALDGPASAYGIVYHLEIVLLFAALAVLGPLVRPRLDRPPSGRGSFGLPDLPS